MGTLTLSAGFSSLLLPETAGAPLLQSIEEAERFKSTRRLFSLKPCAVHQQPMVEAPILDVSEMHDMASARQHDCKPEQEEDTDWVYPSQQ